MLFGATHSVAAFIVNIWYVIVLQENNCAIITQYTNVKMNLKAGAWKMRVIYEILFKWYHIGHD